MGWTDWITRLWAGLSSLSFSSLLLSLLLLGFLVSTKSLATVTEVDLGSDRDQVLNLVPQPDGKLLVCARTRPPRGELSDEDIALVRFEADGQIDPSFGNAGVVLDNLGGSVRTEDAPSRVVVGTDGTIWVNAITEGSSWVLLRYDRDGVRRERIDLPLPPTPRPVSSLGLVADGRGRLILSWLGLNDRQLEWRTVRHDPGSGLTAPIALTTGFVPSQPLGNQRVIAAGSLRFNVALLNGSLATVGIQEVDPTGFVNEVVRRGTEIVLAGRTDAGFAVAKVRPTRTFSLLVLPEFTSAMAATFDDQGRVLAGGTDGDRGILVRLFEDSGGELKLDSSFVREGVKTFGRVGTSTEVRGIHVSAGRLYTVGHGRRSPSSGLDLFLAVSPY